MRQDSSVSAHVRVSFAILFEQSVIYIIIKDIRKSKLLEFLNISKFKISESEVIKSWI